MASRHQRRKRALTKKAAIAEERKAAFVSHERATRVKASLAADSRECYTVRDHHGTVKVVRSTAYSRIADSFVRTVQGGGMRECVNLDRPIGDSDRDIQALKKRLTTRKA